MAKKGDLKITWKVRTCMQHQFLQQQHQYLQHQLQYIQQQQQQQQQQQEQQEQQQHQPPTEQHWSIQGQVVPRPALPAHMLPYAIQSYLQAPYSQPSPLPRHQAPFPQYQTYPNDPNAHHTISNSYLLHQQTADAQQFTNIPDHTPSPSPSPNPPLSPNVEEYQSSDAFGSLSPNPPLSPNVEEYQSSDAIGTASYESSGAIGYEHSLVVDYSNQPSTPVEYPSPAQSPVEHPAEVVISNSRHPQDIDPYSVPISTEVVDPSMGHLPAGVIKSLNKLPQSRTPYTEVSCAVSVNSATGGYSSSVLNTAIDLSCSTPTEGQPITVAQVKTPSKVSSAYVYSNHSPAQGHFKELGSNPVVLNSPQSTPHSPAGFSVPSSPYTSCLPNPPPNSPAVVSYVHHASDSITKFQQYIDGVNPYASENNVILNTRPVAKKPSVDHDKNTTENILMPSENTDKLQLISNLHHIPNGKFHGSISVTKPVFQEDFDEKRSSDSSCSNGYIGAFAALIKSEEPDHDEYENILGNEESENCEKESNPPINQQNKEMNADLGQLDFKTISDSENQKEKDIQHRNENNYEIYCTENKKEDNEKEWNKEKPFRFSPFLYKYLNNEQKEDGIETLDWCSQMCTPPESPSATNSSTPTSSPTAIAAPVPLIILTPSTAYLYPSDENCSAVSELRDEQGVLCQGGDILMRTADGSLRIIGSPVKFDDTANTGGSMSPSHQVESPGHLPISAASSPGSDILGDIMTQVGLVGVSAEEDMCLDEHVIGVMEEKGPSPSFTGEAQEMGYYQQRQFACHLCHCVFHDAWNLQVHMVSHPTPTPRPSRRSKTSPSSPEISSLNPLDYSEFIPPHLTPSLPKGTKFRRGGRRATNKENTSPPHNLSSTPQNLSRTPQNLIGKHLCPECNIGYPSQGHMKRHMESHGANRKFPCDMCNASYSRRDNLDKHRNQHLMNQC